MQDIIMPIGPFSPTDFSVNLLPEYLSGIIEMPARLEKSVQSLADQRLQVPYREGGWNIRQIVHHLADSHMNAYIRCKLALTEDNPIIKPYDQDTWALLPDNELVSIDVSIKLLSALHERWHVFFSHLKESDWSRTVMHPEYNRQMSLWFILCLYAWHGKHHTAQINALRSLKGW